MSAADVGAALGALDRPASGQVVDGLVAVGGWALVPEAGRLELTLDAESLSLELEWYPRPDVEEYLRRHGKDAGGHLSPGFVGMLDTNRLADGEHELCCHLVVGETVESLGVIRFLVDNSDSDYRFVNRPDADEVLHREQIYGSGPPLESAAEQVLALIGKYGRSPLLDVGAGTGAYLAALRGLGFEVTGIEVNRDYVDRARREDRDVVLYDGATIPFDDGAFDTAFAIEVLEHVADWRLTLDEMLRTARRRVLFSVPNMGVLPSMYRHRVVPWHLLESTHVNFFTPRILSHVLPSIAGARSRVFTYGSIRINGEIFDNHIFAVLDKTDAPAND